MDKLLDMPGYLQAAICLMFIVSTLPYLAFFVVSVKGIARLNTNKKRNFEINSFFEINNEIKTTADINEAIEFISDNQKEKADMSTLFDRAALWTLLVQIITTAFVINEMIQMGSLPISLLLNTHNNGTFVGIQSIQFILLFSIYCYMLSINKMNENQFNYEVYSLGELETQFLSADDAKAIRNNKITGEYVERVLKKERKLTRKETDMLLDFIDEEESSARCGISGKILYGE